MVSVDVKHHVYLLTYLHLINQTETCYEKEHVCLKMFCTTSSCRTASDQTLKIINLLQKSYWFHLVNNKFSTKYYSMHSHARTHAARARAHTHTHTHTHARTHARTHAHTHPHTREAIIIENINKLNDHETRTP